MKTRIASNVNHTNSVAILHELFVKLDCSLARYLSYARPWVPRRNMLLDAVVRRLSYEHEIFARRIARLIYDRRGTVRSGVFPIGFMSYNDVSLDYLAPHVLEYERALLAAAEESAEQLKDPAARRVIVKIVVALRRYVALLTELLSRNRFAPSATGENGVTSQQRPTAPRTAEKKLDQAVEQPKTAA